MDTTIAIANKAARIYEKEWYSVSAKSADEFEVWLYNDDGTKTVLITSDFGDNFVVDRIYSHDDYWLEISKKDRTNEIVVGNERFEYGPEDERRKGFAGRKWQITFLDGSVLVTTNLWSQGIVPPKYRELFPNNAKDFRAIYNT